MNDQALIEKISTNPVLQNAISRMVERTKALNLVQTNWREILKNDELFKKFEDGNIKFSKGHHAKAEAIFVRNIIGMQNNFNIIVAGYWSFGIPDENSLEDKSKGVTMVCRLCSPLNEIGHVMMENKQQKLHDNCKFFIETCDPVFCLSCKNGMKKLRSYFSNNWCIFKTKMFNGESIKNHFRPVIENTFGNGIFCGILHLTISSRYTFGDDSLKIGGICREMILFKESALDSVEDLDIEYPSIENVKSLPSITLPPEEIIEGIPEEYQ
ncbi:hypothetical protein HNY73_001052 [Argiope bruennichi]|uniref:Uncharacterized protein n=1 Tax=Argiope bruennichi TaxID=94029 RepID=A0A8T0G1D2_ARGBR|nr:hypothetical protein HNY73_001052 [Argiope bruennichi]